MNAEITSGVHAASCLIWTSSDPQDGCSCAAQSEPLLTLAERLEALPVEALERREAAS